MSIRKRKIHVDLLCELPNDRDLAVELFRNVPELWPGLAWQAANFRKAWEHFILVVAASPTALSILNRAARNQMCEVLCHF